MSARNEEVFDTALSIVVQDVYRAVRGCKNYGHPELCKECPPYWSHICSLAQDAYKIVLRDRAP